ncbi:ABC transporter arginine-binding protein 1 [Pontiella desulfatans]|uniref:Type IV secretion system putative lipoprotein virB7 n=1 Tax=Pontiella desulfatans TaxID=2750659 RepID=A0A6C2UD13_PONDE|nr:transporter substrate-binding domain-containing protein [Pontiella desulfatans]VGO17264.1 ABC transporter arginine-binding protein 1 [Pontiella desulfatans]
MKRIAFLFSIAALLAGCQTTSTVEPDPSILRVGVSPRSQPMIFKQNGQIMGIEADFAQKLGQALNRKVVFVEVPWDQQIDDLEQNKTDIIMSNMTITGARSIRVNFSTPYLQSGLSAMFRRNNFDPSGLVGSTIRNQSRRIGYVKNTTGEFFCRQRFTRGELVGYDTSVKAVEGLINQETDMFVGGAPMVWWQSAVNERLLVSFQEVFNVEPIAWAVGRHNMALLDDVNAQLAKWEKDGTSRKIIQNWIPNFGM